VTSPPPLTLPLLAVPNVSEGRDADTIAAIAAAFNADGGARLLDVHADVDHHRAVFTLTGSPGSSLGGSSGSPLTGSPGSLADALLAGAGEAVRLIDIGEQDGRQHPHVGAVDVVPIVYLEPASRGAACAEALVVADRIGEELGVPVFLYGELAGGRSRAALRRGGALGLARRMLRGELRADFGPREPHPTACATLVAARGPLVAFNLELAPPATVEDARAIASLIREGGVEGRDGLRAIGVGLRRGRRVIGQVSMNVERPAELPLREVVDAVRRYAEVACAELVGLAPAVALEGFPEDVPMPAFDPARQVIERALRS
jgi:glutamate formiminotransferase